MKMRSMMFALFTGIAIVPYSSGVYAQAYMPKPDSVVASSSMQSLVPAEILTHPANDVSYARDLQEDRQLSQGHSSDSGSVWYASGGIGDGGMQQIESKANDYNLKMLFVSKGAYLADVDVAIQDDKGNTVLRTTTQGPILLAKLPPGRYKISTRTLEGAVLDRYVEASSHDRPASYVLRYSAG